LLVPSSKPARRKQKPPNIKNRNEKAGQARNKRQHLGRSARAAASATGANMKPSPTAAARKDLKWAARQEREDRIAALLMKLNQQNTLVDMWR
jgi:hypothetical protein